MVDDKWPKDESAHTESDETDSQAVIDAFLASAELPAETESAPSEEPLPEGHRSGFIAVVGRPNVGKSTLVNACVGEKVSIVSRKPQTTRSRVMGIVTRPTYQLIFVDTPGIHTDTATKLNRLMVEQATSSIPDADVILFVVDVSDKPHEEDAYIAKLLNAKAEKRPVIFVLNKMDALSIEDAESHVNAYWALLPAHADSIPTSALLGTNIELLLEHIVPHMPEGPRYYPGDQITDQTDRKIAAELIREAMLEYTHQEVPHSSAVLIDDYQMRDNGVLAISATIWVERESQRPIVIGKQGDKLKRIGSAARQQLERFVGSQVYLSVWVKIKPKWRDDDRRLRELGF